MSTDSYPNNERVYSGAVLGGNSMKISRIVDLHADAGSLAVPSSSPLVVPRIWLAADA